MTIQSTIMKFVQHDDVNFLLTNCMPRRSVTRAMGWFSKIEHKWVCAVSLRVWGFFTDLDLSDARDTRFRSMHDCFTRRLKDGARPVASDPDVFVSPCDGIIGASGVIENGQMLQVKGSPYRLGDLLGDDAVADGFVGGTYVTLRLTSAMYHRFHAPHDCRVESVSYIPGDAWNVNPPTLRRVDRLFCRNERAVIATRLAGTGQPVLLVPVAAILVAGIRLSFLDMSGARDGDRRAVFGCDVALRKGDEMGWFEHGSTIIVVTPPGFALCEGLIPGVVVRAGQRLLRM